MSCRCPGYRHIPRQQLNERGSFLALSWPILSCALNQSWQPTSIPYPCPLSHAFFFMPHALHPGRTCTEPQSGLILPSGSPFNSLYSKYFLKCSSSYPCSCTKVHPCIIIRLSGYQAVPLLVVSVVHLSLRHKTRSRKTHFFFFRCCWVPETERKTGDPADHWLRSGYWTGLPAGGGGVLGGHRRQPGCFGLNWLNQVEGGS